MSVDFSFELLNLRFTPQMNLKLVFQISLGFMVKKSDYLTSDSLAN